MKPDHENNDINGAMTKQEKALLEFKQRVIDLLKPKHDDHYLRTWLKARGYDIDKSEKMFRESMAYRERMRVDSLIEEYTPPPVLQQYLTGGCCGYDKEGSPIRVESYGYLDMRGIMYSSKKSDLEKTKLLLCERTMRDWLVQTEKTKKRVDGLTVIFDMEHVGTKHLWRPGMQMYLHLVKVLEDNYPEMMKRMFVVNAPRIFPILWKLGRPLVSEDMKNKIHVLGSDFKQTLLKYIDAESLPMYLGGTLTDPDGDPKCRTMICHGGEVPRSFYLSELEAADDMETVTVGKGQRLKVDFEVEIPGSMLRWEFRTDDFDIGFGIVQVVGGKEKETIPVKRVNSHQIGQDGSITCDDAGTYAIVFDNRYSWSRGKVVHYLVELHTDNERALTEVDEVMNGGSWTRLVKNMQITHL